MYIRLKISELLLLHVKETEKTLSALASFNYFSFIISRWNQNNNTNLPDSASAV